MKKLILLLALAMALSSLAQEKTSKKPFTAQVEAGYLFGGQVTTNTFLYQSGFSGRVSFIKDISQTFSLGIGAGADEYGISTYYPTYLIVKAKSNPANNGFLAVHAGYSFTNEKNSSLQINQEYEGGPFLEIGRGWMYEVNSKLDFIAGISLKHQFAELETENLVGEELEEDLNFDTFQIRIGLLIK